MFRIENNVPDVYVQESRDFQLLGRLGDIALQSSRFSINSMSEVTSSKYCNSAIIDLTKTKLGFFNTREIDEEAERAILSAYPHIVRCKGTVRAILLIINLFKQLTDDAISRFEIKYEERAVVIELSKSIIYLDVMKDLIMETLPTGYTLVCRIVDTFMFDSDFVNLSDKVSIVHPKDDNGSEYNIVSNNNLASKFGSRVSTSQVVSWEEFTKLGEEGTIHV